MAINAAALREARQKRLATRADTSQQPQSSLKEEVQIPNKITAAVLDPHKISKAAAITMHLFNSDSNDPHWLVCADGMPVAQVRLSDQEEQDNVKRVFATEAYANGIIESAQKIDLVEILSGIHARPFMAEVEGTAVYEAMKQTITASVTEDLRRTKANLRSNLMNTLGLVINAQTKNFLSENPLKDALFQRMKQAGMESERAVSIIEAAWQDKAADYFETAYKQANKWMDLTPEAYAELEEQIQGMAHRTPMVERDASVKTAGPTSAGNVLLQTYTSPTEGAVDQASSEKEAMRTAFSLRKRQLGHQMSSR